MSDYLGKICPFCKTEFKPEDTIVVCSDCDMPHHKDCWIENQGCTTFGCLGTIKAADGSSTTVTATQMHYEDSGEISANNVVYCTRCGAQNQATSSFCVKCGYQLTTAVNVSQVPVYTSANVSNSTPYSYFGSQNYSSVGYNGYQGVGLDSDLQKLIGTKYEYYIPKFQELTNQNKQTSWNWPAFLVTPYWMIYRRMYGYGAAVLGINFVLSLIGSKFLTIVIFAGYIVLGIYANYIYLRFLEGKANQAKALIEPYKTQFISKNSGTNSTATVLTIIGYVLLIFILSV